MNTAAKFGGIGAFVLLLLNEVPEQYTLYAAIGEIAVFAASQG